MLPELLEAPSLRTRKAESVPFQQRSLIQLSDVQAVAKEPFPISQVPVHARLLLQWPKWPAVGVLVVGAS
jgi:hypothetical protein